jgi:hypothetical protein
MVGPGCSGAAAVANILRLLILASLVVASAAGAGEPGPLGPLGPLKRLLLPDWQGPSDLPPRFRNHCSYDVTHGRAYCSDHCGSDYQFYYCSPMSFGCCHIGVGYCDWDGLLRCRP